MSIVAIALIDQMKNSLVNKIFLTLRFFTLLLFVYLLLPFSAHASAPTIISPNGGEAFNVGDSVQITWNNASTSACSLYYVTPEGGLSTAYYIGGVSDGSVGSYTWTASVPSGVTTSQQEKIQLTCIGQPTDYSDDYFTVNPVSAPVCDKKAEVAFVDTSTPTIYQGQSISNQLAITNPNDPGCGNTLYGLSTGYPAGWSMSIQTSVSVPAGTTVDVPLTLTSSNSAAFQTYSYSVYAGDSNGGVLPGATGNVTVAPRCDATVQASLQSSSLSGGAGTSVANQLVLTNPNISACSPKTYIYSTSYPGGWTLGIQPNVTIDSGQTVSVPFTVGIAPTAAVGSYSYTFWVYNSYADGSGQAQVSGNVDVLDTTAPNVSITNPSGTTVPKHSTVSFTADSSDNVGVSKTEFYVNGTLMCTDTISPYTCSFVTVAKKGEVYTLMVKAYDAAGNTGTASKSVTSQ